MLYNLKKPEFCHHMTYLNQTLHLNINMQQHIITFILRGKCTFYMKYTPKWYMKTIFEEIYYS